MPRCCFIFRASSTVANYWEMTEHLHHVIQHQIHHCEVTLRRDGAEGSSWQFKFRVQLTSCLGSKVLWMSKRGPSLAGRIVSLVVVPGVLVAIAAILWLLETNHSHRKNQWEEEETKKCRLVLLTVCIKIWAHTWYQLLYPAYPASAAAASPPPTTGGGVVMGTCGTAGWVSADASTLEPSSTLSSFSGSSSLRKSRRCLLFLHNQNISAHFLCKVLTKWSSPILCSPLGSTQLIQQPLMSLIHRKHTAVDRSKRKPEGLDQGLHNSIWRTSVQTRPLDGAAVLLGELQSSLGEDDLCVGSERRGERSRHTLLHCFSRGPGVPGELQLQQVHVQFVIILGDARPRKKMGQFYIFSFKIKQNLVVAAAMTKKY